MLNLRIVRGPLQPRENEAILTEYNRLKSSEIPMQEFLHWIQNSPEGPAWHAILETDDEEIVGHQCAIPLRGSCQGQRVVAAKSEYAFLREEFQSRRIRGFEESRGPRHFIAFHQLFQRCQEQGWGPFMLCNSAAARHRHGFYGWHSTHFNLWECLLTLRPWAAARETPNLVRWQRAVLGLIGTAQKIAWSPLQLVTPHENGIRPVNLRGGPFPESNDLLSFFEDQESLRWRYPEGQYERLALDSQGYNYIILKKGSGSAYLRICQWRFRNCQPSLSLMSRLVQMAQQEQRLGLRWAVYASDAGGAALAQRLRHFGFLCAPRIRTLMIKSEEKELLTPHKWNLNDAMFSFHA